MNTKDIGNIAEVKVLGDLVSAGERVLIPWGDNLRYDLAVDDNGNLIRLQVKNARYRKGVVKIKAYRSEYNNTTPQGYQDEIDFVAAYCPDLEEIYYVSIDECSKNITLRVDPPKSKNKNIRWARDYTKIPWQGE